MSTNYFSLVPKGDGKSSDPNYNTGYYSMWSSTGGGFDLSSIFVRAGDDFRYGLPYMCPRLYVGSSFFPHSDLPIVTLPEVLLLVSTLGAIKPQITRANALLWEPAGVYSVGAQLGPNAHALLEYSIRTESVTDLDLRSLGFTVQAGARRRYDIGVTQAVAVSQEFGVFAPSTITMDRGPIGDLPDRRDWDIFAVGTTIIEFETHPYETATEWISQANSNLLVDSFINECGIAVANTQVYIPNPTLGHFTIGLTTSDLRIGKGPSGAAEFVSIDDSRNLGIYPLIEEVKAPLSAIPEMETVGAHLTTTNESKSSFGLANPRGGISEPQLEFHHLASRRQLVQNVEWKASEIGRASCRERV